MFISWALKGMRMNDPKPTFAYLVSQLVKRFPSMAYLHVVEPRVHGNADREVEEGEVSIPRLRLSVRRVLTRMCLVQ